MKRVIWNQLDAAAREQALSRSDIVTDPNLANTVATILAEVKAEGDVALARLSQRFDGGLPEKWQLGPNEMAAAEARIEPELKQAIDGALANIETFHQAQQPKPLALDVQPGVSCELHSEPLDAVGLYVPGGTAPLISTVLMLALPARIAGCRLKVITTPPPVNDAILYTAHRCGVDAIFTLGGAQAVGALAYGTQTVPKVDKIFGPGNRFVTEAKSQISLQNTAIDMPAGPSEVLVIADENANPAFVASDLLSQAEHGEDSQAMLVTTSAELADKVDDAIVAQLAELSRANVARAALTQSRVILAADIDEAIEISNAYAPEHLIVQTDDPRALLPRLRGAGSIFLGKWSPESAGDYASGTNHVLPTYGHAKTVSSLTLADFQRRFTVQELTQDGLTNLAEAILPLAYAEGLDGHAAAVEVRLADGESVCSEESQ